MTKIYAELRSGLGNQLFQYAFAYSLARQYNLDLVTCPVHFDSSWKYWAKRLLGREARKLRLRQIVSGPLQVEMAHSVQKRTGIKNVVEEQKSIDDIRLMCSKGETLYLSGYWQHPEYFHDYRDELIEKLSPKFGLSAQCRRVLEQLQPNSIAIHIRRGDFLTNKWFGACTKDYYRQAIQLATRNVTNAKAVVFTNDRGWVERNFDDLIEYVIYSNPTTLNSDIEEMYLMSRFPTVIIPNSTFSWWGAYLNQAPDAKIYAPTKWFLNEKLQGRAWSLVMPHWHAIENELKLG